MKIFLDTNVLISAFIARGGHSHEILTHAVHQHELYFSDFILRELKQKLRAKFHFSNTAIKKLTDFMERFLVRGETASVVDKICRDPDDDQVLADAETNHVDFILTGDQDLLILKTHKNIRIIAPRDYWAL